MGNSRGTDNSLKHKSLSSESKKYWEFSWHEIGLYDLPVMLDFVLNRTSTERLFYVGHSQGTTSLCVLLTMKPEYNDKIIQAHLLTPAVFMEHFSHPIAKPLMNQFQVSSFKFLNFLDNLFVVAFEKSTRNL